MKSRVWLVAIAVTVALTGALPAQKQSPAETRKKVDAVFADVAKPDSPGCALGVIRDGRLIYSRGYGMANFEHTIPITTRTVFDIGSVSKHFTAAAIVLLAQQAKLSLDDEVRKFVPELPDYGAKLTIRHLLHHTGGVRNYDTLMALAAVDFSGRTGDREALDIIVRQKELNFRPGEDYLYSNSGYFLLSQVVKKASGKTLREFARENIFEPLGMNDTQYYDDTTRIVPRRATGYEPRQGGGFQIEMSNFEQTGDGAVFTTIEDLLLWDRNFYQPRVLGKQGLEWMQTPGVLTSGKKLTYAFGLSVTTYKGLRVVEHGGAWAGYRAHFMRFPEQKLSVACLCNAGNANPGRRARQVAEVYLGAQMTADTQAAASDADGKKTATPALPSAERAKYLGVYRHATAGGLRRIIEERDTLRVRAFGQTFDLVPAGAHEFRWPTPGGDVRVRFEPRDGGGFTFVQFNAEGTSTAYDPVEAFAPTLEQLGEFTGVFYSEEADVVYTVFVRDGKPQLRIGRYREMALEPAFRDAFAFDLGQLLFVRDSAGRISGFSVQAGRVRNIRFARRM